MAKSNSKGNSKGAVNVDFTGVETFDFIPGGTYRAKTGKAELGVNNQGNKQVKIPFEVLSGEHKGAVVTEFFPLIDQALWKLKSAMKAMGLAAEGKVSFTPDKLSGRVLDILVIEDEYNGDVRNKISKFMKATAKADDADVDDTDEDDDDDFDEEEEDTPPAKAKNTGKGKKAKEPEPDDDDDDDDDDDSDDGSDELDYSEMTAKELTALAKERKIKGWKDLKGKKLIKALEKWDADNAPDDDDDDDDDWDEEDDD